MKQTASRQLIKQRLGVLQDWRVETFDEPAANRHHDLPSGDMLATLGHGHVRLAISEYRDRTLTGRVMCAPAVAFAAPQLRVGDGSCGLLAIKFSAETFDVRLENQEAWCRMIPFVAG
jgi:hypothetical protein